VTGARVIKHDGIREKRLLAVARTAVVGGYACLDDIGSALSGLERSREEVEARLASAAPLVGSLLLPQDLTRSLRALPPARLGAGALCSCGFSTP